MKTAFLLTIFVGMAAAASQQPRYQPQVTHSGSTPSNVNPAPSPATPMGKSTPLPPSPQPPFPMNAQGGPIAEARESLGTDASMLQPHAVSPNNANPAQNYYVYYYPNQDQGTAGTAVGQPNSSDILRWDGLKQDVIPGVLCAGAILAGSYILYTKYFKEVKARALRHLKDISMDDAARMARSVMSAIEKFSNMNNNQA